MSSKTFFISTAIPYVNAKPHLGHSLEFVQADILARYQRSQRAPADVFSLSGTDDNALKNVQAAEAAGIPVKDFVHTNSCRFHELHQQLGDQLDGWIATSASSEHLLGCQKLWSSCEPDDIYKRKYAGLYCVGCEEFKLEKDLEDGACPEHPGKKVELVEEENYFFRLSRYGKKLEELITSGQLKIVPETKRNETLAFIRAGLEDFSISRSMARAKGWGVPVPGDSSQVMYVWFDALANYITALGYANDSTLYRRFWSEGAERVHLIGKGINRFHTVYWPAMLLSAGVPLPTVVVIHGYITLEGQKMSKSLGNVLDPADVLNEYGSEVLRFFFARHLSIFSDSDFRQAAVKEAYNAGLANGIGNLVSRVLKMATTHLPAAVDCSSEQLPQEYHDAFQSYDITDAAAIVWREIEKADTFISQTTPFKTIKTDREKALKDITELVRRISVIARMLTPIMPQTSATILRHIQEHQQPSPLFMRRN